jgi:hypothetical protein
MVGRAGVEGVEGEDAADDVVDVDDVDDVDDMDGLLDSAAGALVDAGESLGSALVDFLLECARVRTCLADAAPVVVGSIVGVVNAVGNGVSSPLLAGTCCAIDAINATGAFGVEGVSPLLGDDVEVVAGLANGSAAASACSFGTRTKGNCGVKLRADATTLVSSPSKSAGV